MSIDKIMLRDKIYDMYGTQEEFSKAIGWKATRVGMMLNGKWVPNINHCFQIMETLQLTREEYFKIFLPASIPPQDKKNNVFFLRDLLNAPLRLKDFRKKRNNGSL